MFFYAVLYVYSIINAYLITKEYNYIYKKYNYIFYSRYPHMGPLELLKAEISF